jgi:tetratricopeptide (TPR) repeat protein
LGVLNEFVAKHPADAVALNERCWTKATLGVELSTALSDCDASLKLQPNSPAVLDSRAFAKLRLGQIEGALADYDAALELEPGLPASLYGRAIARARHGDQTGAMVDLALARKLNPDIDARFADYGITLPPSLPSSPQAKYMPRETRSTPGASF